MKNAKTKALDKKMGHDDFGMRTALMNTRKALGHKSFDKKSWEKRFMGKGRRSPDVPKGTPGYDME